MATQKTENKEKIFFAELLKALVSAIEEKDEFMRMHSERVANASKYFAKKLHLSRKATERIYLAGLLHDFGMVCIPLEIIQKTEKLTDEEMDLIKTHPLIAENVLSGISVLTDVVPIIRHHHESYDGGGYPDGLKGEKIPLGSRLLNFLDSYYSMKSPRPQMPVLSMEAILDEVQKNAGQQFDPELVKLFVELTQAAKATG